MSSVELENQCFATSIEIESLESSRKKSRLGKHRGKKKRNINTQLPVKIIREQSCFAYSSPNDSDDLTDTDISCDSYKRDDLMSNQLGHLIYHSSNEESHLKNRFLFPNCQNYSKNQGLKTFHQHFSLLVGLGNQTSNYSKPQENILLKNNDNSLWLSIQAWYNDVNLYEQEEILKLNREKIPDILNEIINFKLNGCNNDDSAVLSESNVNNISCDSSDFQNAYSSSNYVFTLSEETMNSQRFALKKVIELLDKLDFCERQFPTTKALGEVYPLYNQKHFKYQVKSLYLWLNITQELSHKIRLLGCVLQQNVQKRKEWPWFENYREMDNLFLRRYECAWSQLPNSEPDSYINQNVEKSCKHYAFDSFSQMSHISDSCKSTFSQPEVKFDLNNSDQSSLITSPATKFPESHNSKISRSSSYQSYSHTCYEIDTGGESTSKSSFYHDYVDHGLKKMGMHKLLKRLRDLLSGSLSRAEEALCKPQENAKDFSPLSSVSRNSLYSKYFFFNYIK